MIKSVLILRKTCQPVPLTAFVSLFEKKEIDLYRNMHKIKTNTVYADISDKLKGKK